MKNKIIFAFGVLLLLIFVLAKSPLALRAQIGPVSGIQPVSKGGTGTATGSITGTGALNFTAGGANQNISLVPSGTGYVGIKDAAIPPAQTNTGLNVNRVLQLGFFGSTPTFLGIRAQGSLGAETAVGLNNTMLQLNGMGYNGSSYVTGGHIAIRPDETFSGSAQGTHIEFGTSAKSTTSEIERWRMTDWGAWAYTGPAVSTAAWGLQGAIQRNAAVTITDNSTAVSGTASAAAFNSFAAPTLAAANATVTTTDAYNVYIGGAPIAGANQTLARSHALAIGSGRLTLNPSGGTSSADGLWLGTDCQLFRTASSQFSLAVGGSTILGIQSGGVQLVGVLKGSNNQAVLDFVDGGGTPDYIRLTSTNAAGNASVSAVGGSTNINLNLTPKGSGLVVGSNFANSSTTAANSGNGMAQRFRNGYATAAQAPAAATRTYVTGSDVGPFTAAQLQVGTMIHWHLDITKTAAGTASATFDIAFGTAGSTADTARLSFTKPAGVANADHCAVDIYATVKTNSASGVVIGDFTLLDDQTGAGGFLASGKYVSSSTVTSGTFDTTAATHVGLCVTTGASDAWTINHVQTWSSNL